MHRIVIVGGGVAGMEIASTLGRRQARGAKAIEVTLVDRSASHVWKPMLHTIAAGTRDVSQQQTPFMAQAADAGFAFQPGAMCGLDRQAREVLLAPLHAADQRLLIPARRLPYDTLILALGSQANDFGTEGVAAHCWKIDSLEEADAFNGEVRIRMLQCLVQDETLRIAIVGGGATGVELAAELVQLAQIAEAYGANGLRDRISITLIDSGKRLLSAFPEDISAAARQRLESLGVEVLSEARVARAHDQGYTLNDGREVPASLRVWAAGVKAPDFLAQLGGLESVQGNRLQVGQNLQTTRDADIYAVGDCASLILPGTERPLPPTAQVASQQARHLARHLVAVVSGRAAMPAFAYRDFGALVSLGNYDAYGSLGQFGFFSGLTIRGRMAHISHALLYRQHQARIHGFWRGSLLWIVDRMNRRLRSRIRLD